MSAGLICALFDSHTVLFLFLAVWRMLGFHRGGSSGVCVRHRRAAFGGAECPAGPRLLIQQLRLQRRVPAQRFELAQQGD